MPGLRHLIDSVFAAPSADETLLRDRVEQALRESEDRYRELFENANDIVYTHDLRGQFTSANNAAIRATGYSHDELMTMTVDSLVVPDDVPLAREMTGRKLRGHDTPAYELRIRRKDGRQLAVEVNSRLILRAGSPIGVQGIARDITDRREAERSLRASEARFRALLETAPDAMVILDRDAVIRLVNSQAERMFGYAREELLGRSLERLLPAATRERDMAEFKRFAANPRLRPMEAALDLHGQRHDGTQFPVEISLGPLETAEGLVVTAAIRDVTERRAFAERLARQSRELALANGQLERSNRALEQLAYVASHDLQEPLRAVSGYCQLLQRRYQGKLDSDADEFLAFAVDGADRMRQLINDLLAYARIRTRGRPFQTSDIMGVVAEAVENLKTAIADAGAQVTLDLLPTVTGDRSQLVQLFQNLIANAIRYRSEAVPTIHIAAEQVAGQWAFAVRDNGIGIEPRHAEKIFELFQRLHPRDAHAGGTGIGLAICKGIVERHGGRIWVESTPGQGATFHFTLAAQESDGDE